MSRLFVRAGSMLCCLFLLLCLPDFSALAAAEQGAPPLEAAEASDFAASEASSQSKIQVSVSIFENIAHDYLVGPLSLSCWEGTTPAGVLELLCSYAYLDDIALQRGALYAVSVDGETYTAGSDGTSWILAVNGQQMDSQRTKALEGLTLQDGDSLEWIYCREDESQTPALAESGYGIRSVSAQTGNSLWQSAYGNLLNQACSWLKSNRQDATSLYTLGSAGVSVDHKYLTSILKQIVQSEAADSASLAENILAVSFCGISAENVSGRNFIQELEDCPDLDRTEAALALIALDCNGYTLSERALNDRPTLINVILAAQGEDGAFSPSRGMAGTVSATGLALTALAPYCEDQAVRSAVERGVEFLSGQLDPVTGGYLNTETGALSCEAIASVTVALSSLGIQLDDERFSNGSSDLLTLLLTFQQENGGFSQSPGGDADTAATGAAILAMVSQKSAGSPYLLRSPITGEGSPTLALEETVESSESSQTSQADTEPVPSASFLFGAAGLAIGILLGSIVLILVVRLMRRADKEDKGSSE